MESENKKYDPSLWPKERKPKPLDGKADDLGFINTPNGSFYDFDGEYFNKNGFDIHGGWYTKNKEYIYGPDWLSELGCYEDEKEKYLNNNNNGFELDDEEEDDFLGEEGDFAEDDNNEEFDYEKIMKEAELYKQQLNSIPETIPETKPKKKNKK